MTDSSSETPKNTGDANAKRILKYRIVLANILKYAIPKYNSQCIEDIMAMIPVSKKTPDGLFVDEENSEDLEDSKHIAFDLLFPVGNTVADKVDIWCDIEPQGVYMEKTDNKNSYDLATRGVYYLSRMVSRQLTSGGDFSGYGDIHKCYSIWICFDHIDDREWKPTVTRYTFSPAKILDEDNDPPEKEKNAADLMELIIVRAGGSTDDTKSLIGLVNALWRDVSQIPEYIPEEYEGLNSIRKEIDDMCDMRDVWLAEGRVEGRVEGIEIGEVRGEIKRSMEVMQMLLDDKVPFEKALKFAKIDEKTYNEYKNAFSSGDKQ